jgi:rubrerythrin
VTDDERASLRAAAEREAASSAASLAAAERAVTEGRLNVAKVLRASALSARQRAIALARAAGADPAADSASHAADAAQATMAAVDGIRSSDELAAVLRSASASAGLLRKTQDALAVTRDVPEGVVAQMLFVCEECGFTMEGQRAEICPSCGSIAGEFALFAPFFSGTQEHIARRAPEDALAQLRGDADRLSAALVGDDAALSVRPAAREWCAKEIAGHMVDIVELATRRLRALVDPAYTAPTERTPLPWKLLDDQDYVNSSADAIVERFRAGVGELCSIFDGLQPADWRKKADLVSGRTLVVDVASWVANHNVAHMRQIDALLGREQ